MLGHILCVARLFLGRNNMCTKFCLENILEKKKTKPRPALPSAWWPTGRGHSLPGLLVSPPRPLIPAAQAEAHLPLPLLTFPPAQQQAGPRAFPPLPLSAVDTRDPPSRDSPFSFLAPWSSRSPPGETNSAYSAISCLFTQTKAL
jgi:hypothetical protein